MLHKSVMDLISSWDNSASIFHQTVAGSRETTVSEPPTMGLGMSKLVFALEVPPSMIVPLLHTFWSHNEPLDVDRCMFSVLNMGIIENQKSDLQGSYYAGTPHDRELYMNLSLWPLLAILISAEGKKHTVNVSGKEPGGCE